jgi:HK97 family phage prohead protease
MQLSERRFIQSTIRAASVSGTHVLNGIAARFNHLSQDLGGFKERLSPGCFARSLASGKDVAMLADHNSAMVLGRRSNQTLSLWEDNAGLRFRCELNSAVSHASDVYAMVNRGDIKHCSFGFRCRPEDEDWTDEENEDTRSGRKARIPVRTIRHCNLIEVSAVTFPAYDGGATTIDASVEPVDALSEESYKTARRSLVYFPEGVPSQIRSHVAIDEADWGAIEAKALIALTRALRDELHS